MLIDITYKCSMGCTHCLSDCKPDGEDMSVETFKDVLKFCDKNCISFIHLTGGEMFENPNIREMLELMADYCISHKIPLSMATNGRILGSDIDLLNFVTKIRDKVGRKSFFLQVTDDEKFYPTKLDSKSRYRLEKLGALIEGVPHEPGNPKKCLYPQGRALENFNEDWWQHPMTPSCSNARIFVKQNPNITLKEYTDILGISGHTCKPAIAPNGDIKVGESALCPKVASIYDSPTEIMNKIAHFKCQKCNMCFDYLRETNPMGYELLTLDGDIYEEMIKISKNLV